MAKISWRKALREAHGERAWQILLQIAEGHAWVPQLPDGRQGPPQIPTTADRRMAAQTLVEHLYGRSPSAEEIAALEGDQSGLRALSDADLEARVRAVLDHRARSAGSLPAPSEGELVKQTK